MRGCKIRWLKLAFCSFEQVLVFPSETRVLFLGVSKQQSQTANPKLDLVDFIHVDEDSRNRTRIGKEYQADIPEMSSKKAHGNKADTSVFETAMWTPENQLSKEEGRNTTGLDTLFCCWTIMFVYNYAF